VDHHHVHLFLHHEPLVESVVSPHQNPPRCLSARKDKHERKEVPYHTIKFVNVVVVVVLIFVIVIVLIFRKHIVFERFAGEIVDSARNDLQIGMEGEKGRNNERHVS